MRARLTQTIVCNFRYFVKKLYTQTTRQRKNIHRRSGWINKKVRLHIRAQAQAQAQAHIHTYEKRCNSTSSAPIQYILNKICEHIAIAIVFRRCIVHPDMKEFLIRDIKLSSVLFFHVYAWVRVCVCDHHRTQHDIYKQPTYTRILWPSHSYFRARECVRVNVSLCIFTCTV